MESCTLSLEQNDLWCPKWDSLQLGQPRSSCVFLLLMNCSTFSIFQHISWAQACSSFLLGKARAEVKLH